jgi:hypothetical protein
LSKKDRLANIAVNEAKLNSILTRPLPETKHAKRIRLQEEHDIQMAEIEDESEQGLRMHFNLT